MGSKNYKSGNDPAMVDIDFYDLRWARAGLTQNALSDYIAVSLRTIQRWETEGKAPRAVVLLLSMLAGDLSLLPGAGTSWAGWRFLDGDLLSPDGSAITAGQVQALPYLRARVREYQTTHRETRTQALPGNVVLFPGRSRPVSRPA